MKPTLRQRLRYQFDTWMSRGTPAMILMLFALSVAIIVVAGAVITLTGISQDSTRLTFGEAVWESLMRTLDPGTMGQDTGSGFRAVMLGVTLGGIFIVSALIGMLNNAIQGEIERLRFPPSRRLLHLRRHLYTHPHPPSRPRLPSPTSHCRRRPIVA